ncbi:MAG TPA: hypothetical protein VMD59_03395 [Acidimicrobiales bacterium]|nr:hypothetical protein [Acidimicrobiales bacterium]
MTTAEELEIRRRSIAMLPPGAPAIVREDALALLAELAELRRSAASPSQSEEARGSRRPGGGRT